MKEDKFMFPSVITISILYLRDSMLKVYNTIAQSHKQKNQL